MVNRKDQLKFSFLLMTNHVIEPTNIIHPFVD